MLFDRQKQYMLTNDQEEIPEKEVEKLCLRERSRTNGLVTRKKSHPSMMMMMTRKSE